MLLIRYKLDTSIKYGVVKNDLIHELDSGAPYDIKETGSTVSLDNVTIMPPTQPSKIVAIGLNYKEHAQELSLELPTQPLIFLKPTSAIIATGEDIIYPEMSSQVDYEGELGVIIKKDTKNIGIGEAKDHILGYTCVNDVTARDLQKLDIQFTRAKSFDTFCPIGPYIQTDLDPTSAKLKTYVNGELKQDTCTSDMIFDIYYLVSFISKIMTLFPGDIITTGTPKGVSHLKRDDKVVVEIENIGILENRII
ncbi:fumarylacetoacetate hydrolase family protein [Thermodesulfobacteriota bacterium]